MATTLYIDAFNYEGPHSPEDAFNKVADVVAHLVRQKFDRPAITYRHMYIGVTMEEPDAAFSLRMAFDTLTKDQVDRAEQRRAELRAATAPSLGGSPYIRRAAIFQQSMAAYATITPDASGDDGEGE